MNDLLQWLVNLDTSLFLWINGWHPSQLMDQTIFFLTDRWVWVPFYVALAAYVVYKEKNITSLFIIMAIGASVGLADYTCASVIRPFVERLRPSNLENPVSAFTLIVNDYRGGRFGFPSCHAANTSALAAFISLYYRKRWLSVGIMAWVVLQCYTRLYLGVHYPGDILVGLILGVTCAFIVYKITITLRQANIRRNLPLIPGMPKVR